MHFAQHFLLLFDLILLKINRFSNKTADIVEKLANPAFLTLLSDFQNVHNFRVINFSNLHIFQFVSETFLRFMGNIDDENKFESTANSQLY